jgi:hypothetical protein
MQKNRMAMTAQMWFSSAISLVIGPLPRLVCVSLGWLPFWITYAKMDNMRIWC